MKNPYEDLLKDYVNTDMRYKEDFCELMGIEPKVGIEKTRQLKTFEPYMEIDINRNNLRLSKLYDENEMLLVKRNANFSEYFENLLIVHLSKCKDNVAKFTYSEVEQLFFMVNSNYIKTKYNKDIYITSKDLKRNYNRLDFDDHEVNYDLSKNINLFFDISDRTLRRVIKNALSSMQSKSLILVNESYRLYKEVYDRELDQYKIKTIDCSDEQKNEILDIRKRTMDKYNLKTDKDLFFMNRIERQNYYADFNYELKHSPLLEGADRCGKLFVVNLGKEGLNIEAEKIDTLSNEKMINSNVQYKLLTTKELMCVTDWLKKRLIADTINITDF